MCADLASLNCLFEKVYASGKPAGSSVRKQQGGTSIPLVLVLLLVAAVLVLGYLLYQTRHKAQLEKNAHQELELVLSYIEDSYQVQDQGGSIGEGILAKEVLEQLVAGIDQDFADQPQTQARL